MTYPKTLDGTAYGSSMSCEWTYEPDGYFNVHCHFCGEDVAYGSCYGSDGEGKPARIAAKHDRKHRCEFDD